MTDRVAVSRASRAPEVDVLVIGGGVIGLAVAVKAADAGARVHLLDARHTGGASRAAAGMLAPSVERKLPTAAMSDAEHRRLTTTHAVAIRSRDRYPDWTDDLARRAGHAIPCRRDGVLHLATDDADAERLHAELLPGSEWLDPAEVARLEPSLAPTVGALLHPHDGAVDNFALVEALEHVAARHERLTIIDAAVRSLRPLAGGAAVDSADGRAHAAARVVLAAGAWAPTIGGLPRTLPVEAVRGQMLRVATAGPTRVVYGPGGYILPRGGDTLVGATMERVGFDPTTTDAGAANLRAAGAALCPAIFTAAERDRWAGLRPITPDFLPILGADPAWPALIYAVGHSRNGILLAPETARLLCPLLLGRAGDADLEAYGVTRFAPHDPANSAAAE